MARTILVIGPSGRGKSYSLRNLPASGYVVINTERKSFPFKNQGKIPQVRPISVKETYKMMDDALKDTKIKMIVVDSLSAFLDGLLAEARVLKTGWDVFTHYNEKLGVFFERLKQFNDAGKTVIVFGHDDVVSNEMSGESVISTKVKGNEWKGVIEKEFDIVFHAELEITEAGERKYIFRTQTDGKVPAKSPAGMFDDLKIENDLSVILSKIKEYDKPESNTTEPLPEQSA